jgi:endonuclease YncB( thermonuclease family)
MGWGRAEEEMNSCFIGAILSVFITTMALGGVYPKNMTEVVPVAPEVKSPTAFVANLFSTTCVRVLNGDTFEVSGDKGKQTVRFANVTSPIPPQAYGEEAKKFLQHLIEGKTIALDALRWNTQQQLICHCYYRNTDIEILMTRAGLAYSHVAASVDLDLEKAQKMAQKEGRGMWNKPIPNIKSKKNGR